MLGVAVLLSGCAGDAAPKQAVTSVKSAPEPVVRLPAGASAVEGYVIDDEMAPVFGAKVSVNGLPLATLSRVDGRFFLGPMTPGSYHVSAEHEGYKAAGRVFQAKADETLLIALVLYPLPSPEAYETVSSQKGIVACGAAAKVTANGLAALYQDDLYQDCSVRSGSAIATNRPIGSEVNLNDRSGLTWAARDTAAWDMASLEVRWAHGSGLSQRLSASVSGPCGTKMVELLSGSGVSPLKVTRSESGVKSFLKDSGETACSTPVACDGSGCSLVSIVRAAPSVQGGSSGAGLAVQQAFEATLVLGYNL